MGIVKKPSIKDYWCSTGYFKNYIIPSIMTRDRFEQINSGLQFSDENFSNQKNRLHKFLCSINERFRNFIKIPKNLTIDESLLLWKGRLSFKI